MANRKKEHRAKLSRQMDDARAQVAKQLDEKSADRELEIYRMYTDKGMRSPLFYRTTALYQLIYSICGLILGLACVIGGIILFLRGVTGSTSWTAKFLGAESNLSDAAPGVMLFVVGLFIVLVTRYKLKHRPDR